MPRRVTPIGGLTSGPKPLRWGPSLSEAIDVLTLAKISGHKDLRILQDAYCRETAAEIAVRL